MIVDAEIRTVGIVYVDTPEYILCAAFIRLASLVAEFYGTWFLGDGILHPPRSREDSVRLKHELLTPVSTTCESAMKNTSSTK